MSNGLEIVHKSKKTREVFPCAAEKYALIEAVEARQRSVTGGDGTQSLDNFENDPIAEVFGNNKRRSYCHAISSTCNIKQVKLAQASKAIATAKENANKQYLTNLENSQNVMHEEIKLMSLAIANLQQAMKFLINQSGGSMTA